MPIAAETVRSTRIAPYTQRASAVRQALPEAQSRPAAHPAASAPALPPRALPPAPASAPIQALRDPPQSPSRALQAAVRAGLEAACGIHPALPSLPQQEQRTIVQRMVQGRARGAVQDGQLMLDATARQLLAGLEVLELSDIASLCGLSRPDGACSGPLAARQAALRVVSALLAATPHLRRLSLAGNGLRPSELRAVLESAPATLVELSLAGNPVGANPLAAMPPRLWGSLIELSLVSTQLTDAGLRTMQLELAPNLRVLHLDDNAISAHGLARADLGDHRLQLLSLRRNRLYPPSSRLFAGLAELQADRVDLRDQHGAGVSGESARLWREIYTLTPTANVGHWIRSVGELDHPIEFDPDVRAARELDAPYIPLSPGDA